MMHTRRSLITLIWVVFNWSLVGCSQVYDRLKPQDQTQVPHGTEAQKIQLGDSEKTRGTLLEKNKAFEEQQPQLSTSQTPKSAKLLMRDASLQDAGDDNANLTDSNLSDSTNTIGDNLNAGSSFTLKNPRVPTKNTDIENLPPLNIHNNTFNKIREANIDELLNKQ